MVERTLREAGFAVEKSVTLGYGPFTFFDRKLFSEERAIRIHRRLGALAARHRLLARTGAQHLVLARRSS